MAGCVLAIAGVGCAPGGRGVADCDRGVDGRAWRGTVAERQRESDVIVSCGFLIGATRSEVRRTLGPPTERDGPLVWRYVTGPVRRWGIDDEFLQIRFARGRVVEARRVEG